MRPPKICLVGNSLSFGGADKIHAVLSNYFASEGSEVHNIIFIDAVTYDFSGELLNLGAERKNGGIFDLLRRFNRISDYLKKHDFDFIIDFRTRHKPLREFFLARLFSRYRYIPTIHSYKTEWYFTPNAFVAKRIFKNAFKIVCVASEIEDRVKSQYGYGNVVTIANPLELDKIESRSNQPIDIDFRYVLAAGRMAEDDHKQFAKLMMAFLDSDLPRQGIKLLFLGDGPNRREFEDMSKNRGLPNVFKGFVDNLYPYLKNAEFTVLVSKFEGLPNILAESLAVGTPVVSFDCQSGPRDLVNDRENGLLVENQNWTAFAEALNEMANDAELRKKCGDNAKSSVARMEVSKIGQIWKDLLK